MTVYIFSVRNWWDILMPACVPPNHHQLGELADLDRAAAGTFSYQEPFNDMDIPKIEALPDAAWHRNVDLEVVKADNEGLSASVYVKIDCRKLNEP